MGHGHFGRVGVQGHIERFLHPGGGFYRGDEADKTAVIFYGDGIVVRVVGARHFFWSQPEAVTAVVLPFGVAGAAQLVGEGGKDVFVIYKAKVDDARANIRRDDQFNLLVAKLDAVVPAKKWYLFHVVSLE